MAGSLLNMTVAGLSSSLGTRIEATTAPTVTAAVMDAPSPPPPSPPPPALPPPAQPPIEPSDATLGVGLMAFDWMTLIVIVAPAVAVAVLCAAIVFMYRRRRRRRKPASTESGTVAGAEDVQIRIEKGREDTESVGHARIEGDEEDLSCAGSHADDESPASRTSAIALARVRERSRSRYAGAPEHILRVLGSAPASRTPGVAQPMAAQQRVRKHKQRMLTVAAAAREKARNDGLSDTSSAPDSVAAPATEFQGDGAIRFSQDSRVPSTHLVGARVEGDRRTFSVCVTQLQQLDRVTHLGAPSLPTSLPPLPTRLSPVDASNAPSVDGNDTVGSLGSFGSNPLSPRDDAGNRSPRNDDTIGSLGSLGSLGSHGSLGSLGSNLSPEEYRVLMELRSMYRTQQSEQGFIDDSEPDRYRMRSPDGGAVSPARSCLTTSSSAERLGDAVRELCASPTATVEEYEARMLRLRATADNRDATLPEPS